MATETSQRAFDLLLVAVVDDQEFGPELAEKLRALAAAEAPPKPTKVIDVVGAGDDRD